MPPSSSTPLTVVELHPAVGARVDLRAGSLLISCIVQDVKVSWGKPRFLLVPVVGSGSQWVEFSRLIRPTAEVATA